jgi:hypothetical protein
VFSRHGKEICFGLASVLIFLISRLEAGPLVKGVPNAIHQSFLTRAEATRMFAEQQARGRTRIIDPDLDATPLATPPQRARNYSAPSPFPPATSTFGMAPVPRGHHRSPVSVHPTTTPSRNRTSDGTPSLSDRRAPILSGTSHSSPATLPSNPRSALGPAPSLSRFQTIQAALEQESASCPVTPARSQGQVRRPFLSNTNTPNSPSLAPVPGPSSSSRTRPLQRAETASPDVFRSPKTYTSGPFPASTIKHREPASSIGFDVRPQPVNRAHTSHTNAYTNTQPNQTTSAPRASNPNSTSQASSSSRVLQRTPLHTPDTSHSNSRLAAFDTLGRSSVSPRAVVGTPEWLPAYPTTRTPSPDSTSSVRTRSSSTGPSDELLSPLSNVNLNSFTLDNHPRRGNNNTKERNSPSGTVNASPSNSTPTTQSLSPSVFSNGTPHQSSFTSTSPGNYSGSIQLQGGPRRIEVTPASDPRSPILGRRQIPELAYTKR